LLHGAALLPFSVPAQGVERLAHWIVEERITLLQTVPTVLRRLCEAYAKEKPPALLRCVRIAGEAVLPADVALFRWRLGSQCRLQLVYATTETGTIAQMELGEGEALRWPLPAGRPVERVAVTIEEAGGQEGTGLGEIVVESGCIHRGYWRGIGCVEELGQAPSWRQHRTGDLGRFRADGILEWHGRADDQVKVRGQRIELAEVEAALRQLPNVREAAAGIFVAEQARRSGGDTVGGGGEQRLAAYLVVQDPRKASIRAWRSALRGILPGGLVPDAFVLLPELPVGAGGKVDRKALPVPAGRERGDGAEVRGPRDSAEKVLTEIWEDVLGISGIGRDEDFFALGGDSLLAIAIVARIEAEFGKLPAVSMFLQAGTIELQAAALAQEWESQKSTLVAIQPGEGGGALPTLYCVQNVNGEVMRYADLARELGSGQPLYGLQSPALLGEWPARSLKELARRQAREIVEKHGTAPCHLLGHCVGAYVALEMARELAAMGKPVGLVTIIDTPVPTRSPWNRSGSFRKRFTDRVAHRVRLLRWRIKLAAADLSGKGKALRTGAAWRRFADRAYDDAVRRYRPSRYPGKVLAFLAEEPARPASIDSRLDLVRTYLPDCQTRWVGGTHVGCLRRPYVCAMGRVLGAFLRSGGETPGEE
jgi:thioesterase domain-containing protein